MARLGQSQGASGLGIAGASAVQAAVMRSLAIPWSFVVLASGIALLACQPKEADVSADLGVKGDECDPTYDPKGDPEGRGCEAGLGCEPVAGADTYVCATPLRIHGQVVDAITLAPLEGALVNGLDRTGAPLGEVAVSDVDGRYELLVSAARLPDGELAPDAAYTLQGFARDHQPFPAGIRVALPISAADAALDEALGAFVIENPTTTVGLIPLPADERGGVTISGQVLGAAPGGTMVVAEGQDPAPYTVADSGGAYTLFNVRPGAPTLRGYRRGLEVTPRTLTVAGVDQTGVDLEVLAEGNDQLAAVSGAVNIVDAPGGSLTSVVLVPSSVFNGNLLRGPVPFGLRAPDPGVAPNVSGSFVIPGVPAGTYKVLAGFENDNLVRDPDLTIAGTSLVEITVEAGRDAALPESFKITGALAVTSPGKDRPEVVSATPTFVFADDASEDRYIVRVFDVFGGLVWEDTMVPGVMGSATVEVPYAGPALTPGMYYQFRATSARDKGGGSAISQTEDLRGVFIVEG